jgi:hypothetical protein
MKLYSLPHMCHDLGTLGCYYVNGWLVPKQIAEANKTPHQIYHCESLSMQWDTKGPGPFVGGRRRPTWQHLTFGEVGTFEETIHSQLNF